jgi:hypothetical protein
MQLDFKFFHFWNWFIPRLLIAERSAQALRQSLSKILNQKSPALSGKKQVDRCKSAASSPRSPHLSRPLSQRLKEDQFASPKSVAFLDNSLSKSRQSPLSAEKVVSGSLNKPTPSRNPLSCSKMPTLRTGPSAQGAGHLGVNDQIEFF